MKRYTLQAMSFNIRYDNPNNGENVWSQRKEKVASLIRQQFPEVIGIQEALKNQIDDLMVQLPEYEWFGVGREDGKERGEFVPIFYNKNRLKVIEQSTFWLSETPQVHGGYSWDAKYGRTVTWGKFFDKKSKKTFFFFNTHFDKDGEVSRIKNAEILVSKIEEIAHEDPVVLVGDFNCVESSEPYQLLTAAQGREKTGEKKKLEDTRYTAQEHTGPKGTISDFKTLVIPERKIDYIFVKNNVTVLTYSVVSTMWDGRFPSDHLPIVVKILL
jgi:endonuclease/exonuclease/phosphatase family metal-dependent hydrolase